MTSSSSAATRRAVVSSVTSLTAQLQPGELGLVEVGVRVDLDTARPQFVFVANSGRADVRRPHGTVAVDEKRRFEHYRDRHAEQPFEGTDLIG